MTATTGTSLVLTFSSNPFSAAIRERIPKKIKTANPAHKRVTTASLLLLGFSRLDESVLPDAIFISAARAPAAASFDSFCNISFLAVLDVVRVIGSDGSTGSSYSSTLMNQAENGGHKYQRRDGRRHQSSNNRPTKRRILLATVS